MGVVFLAEQSRPVQRKVALKIIKPGMDTRQVIARFAAEQQALALMDHPNIARVFDAGATESGRPYFVMELVKGVPITEYCDQQHLTPQQRLELFIPICHALQHAHQKGIIHRDLKPSNVLVALYDGRPVPKVIDFGVAKATGPKLTERTMFTEIGQVVGTLEYMSPEQAELNQLDVDTRSDIYSLGVLLYELLTGTTPFERKRLKAAAFLELLRIIREEEPPKPSTRLSTAEQLPSIAANRSLEPKKLSGFMRGDLDWIVMKALEKDRSRRYETANALSRDLERFLADEPVEAAPPSTAQRVRRFVRRNKRTVLAAAAVLTTLIIGVIGTSLGLVQAQQQRQLAEGAKQRTEEQQHDAVTARQLAEQDRQRAVAQQELAQQAERTVRRNLYTAHVTLVEQSLEQGDTGSALALLEAERPQPIRDEDLRGFEWYHLWWRCHEGHRLTLRGHRGPVNAVAFSPDGTSLASGSDDGSVKLWDVASGSLRMTLKGHTDQVTSVAFSPDGRLLASGSRDCTAKLWDVATGSPLATFSRHLDAVSAVAFSPDGKTLATGSANSTSSTARLWDISTKKELANLTDGHFTDGSKVCSLVFFPDGKTLAMGLWYDVQLWDVATRHVRSTFLGDRLNLESLAVSRDGKMLALAGSAGVRLMDVETGQQRAALKVSFDYAHCVAFSPDGKTLGLGNQSGDVVRWDPSTGQKRVYAHTGGIRSVAFSPDGKTLASGSEDRTVKLWDVATEPRPNTLDVANVLLWCVAFSPDGKTAAFAGDNRLLKLWDVATMQPLGTLSGHTDNVVGVAFSHDGRTLASCGDDAAIRLWDLNTRQQQGLLEGHSGGCHAVAFSPDDRTLASSGNDRTIRLWDLATRKERATLRNHTDWVWSVAFSPDGQTVASGSDDATIKLWDAATGRERLTIRGFAGQVRSLAFSHDGGTLFSPDRGSS